MCACGGRAHSPLPTRPHATPSSPATATRPQYTEILYNAVKEGTPLENVQRYICNRAASVCKKKPPPLTKRSHDEKFQVMTADEKQMIDMQANLKETGMSGTMYRCRPHVMT